MEGNSSNKEIALVPDAKAAVAMVAAGTKIRKSRVLSQNGPQADHGKYMSVKYANPESSSAKFAVDGEKTEGFLKTRIPRQHPMRNSGSRMRGNSIKTLLRSGRGALYPITEPVTSNRCRRIEALPKYMIT